MLHSTETFIITFMSLWFDLNTVKQDINYQIIIIIIITKCLFGHYISGSVINCTFWHVILAKTQISRHIFVIWSTSSLSAWRNQRPLAPYEDQWDCAAAKVVRTLLFCTCVTGYICSCCHSFCTVCQALRIKWASAWQNLQNGLSTQRPGWSESSLSTWRKLGSLATRIVYSKDSDQTGQTPKLIWVLAGCTCHFVGFVMSLLMSFYYGSMIYFLAA